MQQLGAAMFGVLAIVVGLIGFVFQKPSLRTRVVVGSVVIALALVAVILSLDLGRGKATGGAASPATIRDVGHDWPVLPIAWTAPAVDAIRAGPLVTGTHLVVRTDHRRIQVFNADNGTTAWPPYPTRDEDVPLSIVGSRIVLLDRDDLIALSIVNGKRLWEQNLKGLVSTPKVVVARDLILIMDSAKLRALDAATGQPRWTWDSRQKYLSEIVAYNQDIFIADDAGRIYNLDFRGILHWTYIIPQGDPVELPFLTEEGAQPMVVVGNVLLFPAGPGGNVYAISTDTHQELWHQSFGELRAIRPGNGRAFVSTFDRVVAMDASSGKELWSQDLSNTVITPQRVYGVTTIDEKVTVVAVDADGGKILWRVALGKYLFPITLNRISSGVFVYVTDGTSLYMLDPATGRPRGIYRNPEGAIGSLGASTEVEVGKLTVVSIENRLVALSRG